MHTQLAKQLAAATTASGDVDLDKLCELVTAAYEAADEGADSRQRSLLEALEVVSEGIALFDADDRFVLWNKRYEEMYPSDGSLRVGVRFEDFLRNRLALKRIPEAFGREEEWLAKRLAHHRQASHSEEQQLPGDRWVRIDERRTTAGGVVTLRVDITDLKRREASFRLLFDDNPIPMLVCADDDLRLLAVNEAAIDHYGYNRDEFLRLSVLDLRYPEDRESAWAISCSGEGRRQSGQIRRHLKADGAIIHVAVYSRPLPYQGLDATLFAAIDITERRKAEEELERTREFLNIVVENIPVTLTVKDARDFRYVLVNKAAEQFMGLPRAQIIGKTAHDFFPKASADAILERDKKLLQVGRELIVNDQPVHVPESGHRFITSRRLTIPDAKGRPKYLLGVVEDVTELKQAQARAAHLARHDPLTGLPNRLAFGETLDEILDRAVTNGEKCGLVCIDVDRFKEINDVFGHSSGDALLVELTHRLTAAAEGAFLARLGGDEFTFIVTSGPQPAATASLAQRIQAAVSADFDIKGAAVRTGISVGVAIFPTDGADPTTLFGNASAALYRAKAEGRGSIRFFEADMDQRLRDQRHLQHELQSAIESNELVLHYQPQACIDASITGFEALVRWNHPTRGLIQPVTFIPLAEESRLIIPMGEWILRQVCRQAASWPRPLKVAVNLSPIQFSNGDLPELVHTILLETGLSPQRLELEVTEGVLIRDFIGAVATLRRLKALGVRVAMDDFGTGYSSLSYLQAFPFDKIKIDKSFISSLGRSPQSSAIIRAVIGLAHGLDLPVVAEGVETKEQLDFLARESCDEIQGYLIGRPLPIEAYADLTGVEMPPRLSRAS